MRTASVLLTIGFATFGVQPPSKPAAADDASIQKKLSELSTRVRDLRAAGADPALIADVDIYRKAAEYIVRFPEEMASEAFAADTLAALDTGLARARELAAGAPSWPKRKGHVVR